MWIKRDLHIHFWPFLYHQFLMSGKFLLSHVCEDRNQPTKRLSDTADVISALFLCLLRNQLASEEAQSKPTTVTQSAPESAQIKSRRGGGSSKSSCESQLMPPAHRHTITSTRQPLCLFVEKQHNETERWRIKLPPGGSMLTFTGL